MPKVGRKPRGGSRRTRPGPLGALPFTLLSDATPLIGRDRELEVLRQHLLNDAVRLLTIAGPGGVGKTRLALAAARCVQAVFPDDVWFIDLLPLQDPADLERAISHALHLEEVATRAPRERVAAYLEHRRALLVLDNFEHVLPAATRVAELLAICPYLKVLVTSREPLNLRLEQRMILAGLALPDLARPTPENVAQAASGALFVARARLVKPDFALSPEDARAIAELVHRLDGIPLGIQIAAARINVLSPTAMLERLQGPALLSSGEALDAPARQHTLRDTIEWSHALLNAGEQSLFRQLGTFAGGWTLDAAEQVVQGSDAASPVWRTLGSLVDKGLVQTESVDAGDRRYRMLETIRAYALEQLAASGQGNEVRQWHAAYYLALAERADAELWTAAEFDWLRRMEREHENVRAALQWAMDRRDGESSVRLAGALADVWWLRGYLREGRRWLEQALALGPDVLPRFRVKALVGVGTIAGALGDHPAARAYLRHGAELAEAVHDSAATARALTRLGMIAAFGGDAREAQALLERSLAIDGVNQGQRAATLFLLGWARLFLGDLEHAAAALTESLELTRAVGIRRFNAAVLGLLARIKLAQGDADGAAALAVAALTSPGTGDHSRAVWIAVATAALVNVNRGNFDHAVRLLAAGDAWSETTGDALIFGPGVREAQEKVAVRARDQMGEPAYRAAVAEGRALSPQEVVDLARTGLEAQPGTGPLRMITPGGPSPRGLLSDRQQAVLRLIAEGLPNKQIATSLGISERSVKTHLTSAMRKLEVENRAQAAVAALRRGLL